LARRYTALQKYRFPSARKPRREIARAREAVHRAAVNTSRRGWLNVALALSLISAWPAAAADDGPAEDSPPRAYWSRGNARPFVALDLEAGA